jgi:excisionase family DNA binding protein
VIAASGYRLMAEETTPGVPGESAAAPITQRPESKPTPPALMTVEEAARYLAISRSRMFELLAGPNPAIPSLTIGPRQRRIRVADLDDYIERRLVNGGAAR